MENYGTIESHPEPKHVITDLLVLLNLFHRCNIDVERMQSISKPS